MLTCTQPSLQYYSLDPALFTMDSSAKSTVLSSKTVAASSPPGGGEGWDFGDSDWGSFDTPSSSKQPSSGGTGQPASGTAGSSARQDLQQKKREERKLKQQAAREKRAAGMSLKPGLGAVKKD